MKQIVLDTIAIVKLDALCSLAHGEAHATANLDARISGALYSWTFARAEDYCLRDRSGRWLQLGLRMTDENGHSFVVISDVAGEWFLVERAGRSSYDAAFLIAVAKARVAANRADRMAKGGVR